MTRTENKTMEMARIISGIIIKQSSDYMRSVDQTRTEDRIR